MSYWGFVDDEQNSRVFIPKTAKMQYRDGARFEKKIFEGGQKCLGHNLPPGRERVNWSAKMHDSAVIALWLRLI